MFTSLLPGRSRTQGIMWDREHYSETMCRYSGKMVFSYASIVAIWPCRVCRRWRGRAGAASRSFKGRRRGASCPQQRDGGDRWIRLTEQARETAELRDRLTRLSEASLRINESLDFEAVLREVLDSARSLTGAMYGVITVMDDSGGARTSSFPD